MPTAYLSPSLLRELTDVSVSNPGAGEAGRLLTWNGTAFVLRTSSESRTDLGLGTLATQSASNVSITGGNITGLSSFSVENLSFNPIQIRRINTNQFAQGLSFYKGRIGSNTLSGDQLVRVMAFGSIEAGNFASPSNNQDFLTAYASGDFTATSQPRDIRFFTVNTGTITASERLRIEPTGQVRIIAANLQATNTTSGALVVAGGVGIGGAVYNGGNLVSAGAKINFANLPTSETGLAVGDLWRDGNAVKVKT